MAKLPDDYEKYASPFSTAFGGTAASTELDVARQYASPFSTAFGGSAPTFESEVAAEDTGLPEGVVPGYGAGTPMSVYNQASNLEEPGYGIQTNEETGSRTITNRVVNADGSVTLIYSDGTSERVGGTSTTANTATTDLIAAQNQKAIDEAARRDRQSAYDILYNEFNKYGLGSLVEDIKGLIQSNVSPSQFAIELQNTKAYQQRFSANQDRIKAGLRALTPAEYVGLEDQYQNIMRNYGLPATYYTKDATGKQSGFDKFLAGDVSASELEDRIATAQQRVLNSNPEVLTALKQFYPDISNADILAYTLDPQNALTNIKRKVTAAEIGGAALAQGLQAQGGTAESLAGQGITKAQAQQGYTEIAGLLPRASQLSDIYNQGPYTQGTAEAEVFNTAGAAEAKKKRQKLTALETAAFSGSSGVGALGRDKAAYGATYGQAGQY